MSLNHSCNNKIKRHVIRKKKKLHFACENIFLVENVCIEKFIFQIELIVLKLL